MVRTGVSNPAQRQSCTNGDKKTGKEVNGRRHD
jgi:hypothetical protein